jgi:hypothetical protein
MNSTCGEIRRIIAHCPCLNQRLLSEPCLHRDVRA